MYNMIMSSVVQYHPSVVSKQYLLNAKDRCDSCDAQAYVKVKGLPGELMFCNHHYNKIMNDEIGYEKMMSFMLEVIDEREKLIENKPTGGAN
jgi:hypothetical protein